jgi:hypothetical protein
MTNGTGEAWRRARFLVDRQASGVDDNLVHTCATLLDFDSGKGLKYCAGAFK